MLLHLEIIFGIKKKLLIILIKKKTFKTSKSCRRITWKWLWNFTKNKKFKVGVINLMGNVFMRKTEDVFKAAKKIKKKLN